LQVDQQLAAPVAGRADQAGAGEIDDRSDFPGEAGRLRLTLEDPVQLVPSPEADRDQQADQRESPPEQAESQRLTSRRSGGATR